MLIVDTMINLDDFFKINAVFFWCLNLAIFHTNSPLFRPWFKFLVKVLYRFTLFYHCLGLVELWFCDKHKLFGFYLECICRYIALVDCICMEDVWHANLTCRGHPHVPGNISSYIYYFAISTGWLVCEGSDGERTWGVPHQRWREESLEHHPD